MKSTSNKLIKSSGTLAVAILAALASPLSLADDSNWYIGGNVGQTSARIDDERISNSLMAQGFVAVSIEDDDRDNGYKIFGGYQVNEYFAVEAGYFDLGEFGYTATTVPAGTLTGNMQLQGVFVDLVGIMPVSERFSVFGRVGANYAEAKDTFIGTGAVTVINPNPSKRDTNYKFGAGLQYNFTESFAMRLEAERYRIDDAIGNIGDVDLYSVGLLYRFGGSAAPVVAETPVSQPVADCSTMDNDGDGVNNCNDKCPSSQAGQAIGPDGCPVPLTIDLRGVNFDFDRDTLRPDAVVILDEAVSILVKYPQLRVEVAGHTDSKGTEEYNQDLSQRRARVVFDYLINHGIDTSRLGGPTGYGEGRPIAPNENSDGSDNPDGRAKNRRSELNVQN